VEVGPRWGRGRAGRRGARRRIVGEGRRTLETTKGRIWSAPGRAVYDMRRSSFVPESFDFTHTLRGSDLVVVV
jgi:hypothetical protein